MKTEKIDCMRCEYFYVTWDRNYPKGCRAFQFKTSRLPSAEVMRASGQPCLRYKKKVKK